MAAVLDHDVADTSADPKGSRSTEEMREAREKDVRDAIRASCRDKLLACAREAGTAMSAKDVEDYIRMGLEEDKLAYAKEEHKKTAELRKYSNEYVPLFVSQTKAAGAKALALLQEARAEKAISTENMAEWKGRLKGGKWEATRDFIDKKLPTYVANWKKVAADRRGLLKDPRFKALKGSDAISKTDLAEFTNNVSFLNAHYDRRKALVQAVKNAMSTMKNVKSMPKLKAEAKAKLAGAAASGILAKGKVDAWMQRIFKAGKTPDQIEAFLNGSGGNSLGGLMANWADARKHFDKVDGRIKKEGAPRGMYVMSLDVFLGMHFDKRMAYIEKVERSFRLQEIAEKGERTELNSTKLEIGHAMHMKDWEYANDLLGDALKKFPEDKTLLSMHKTASSHLRKGGKENKGEELEKRLDRAAQETQEIIDTQFPDSEKKHITKACEHPDQKNMERVAQVWYNRVWCHKHRFLSKEIEHKQRTSEVNKEKTRQYQDYGHSKTYEANILGGDTAKEEAVRDNCRKPQVLHVKEDGKHAAYEKIKNNRGDEWFGYWTSYIPEGLEYEKHKYIVENWMYKLKRNKRLLAANGRDFHYHEEQRKVVA